MLRMLTETPRYLPSFFNRRAFPIENRHATWSRCLRKCRGPLLTEDVVRPPDPNPSLKPREVASRFKEFPCEKMPVIRSLFSRFAC